MMKRLIALSFYITAFFLHSSAQQCLTLDECLTLAFENNIKIRTARIDISIAEQQRKEARAAYLPVVSAGATYFHANDYLIKEKFSLSGDDQQQLAAEIAAMGIDPTVLAGIPTEYTIEEIRHGTFVNLMAMEPIYAGGRITAANKLTDLQTAIRKLQLSQSRNDVRLETEKYYYSIVSLHEKLRTIALSDSMLAAIRRDVENAVEAGLAERNDLLSVTLRQNEVKTGRLKAENALRLLQIMLSEYIGADSVRVDAADSVIAKETEQLDKPSSLFINADEALSQRIETRLLDLGVQARETQKRLKQGERLPSLAVGGALIYQDMTNTGKTKALALATLTVPISKWWSDRGVRQGQLELRKAQAEREDNRQLMAIEIQSCYDNLDNAYRRAVIARDGVEQARENMRLNSDYYHAGTTTMSELLEAQTKEQQAIDTFTDAVIDYMRARSGYLIATGR